MPQDKVCITATGVDRLAGVDPRFGRAAHLLLYDAATGELLEIPGACGAEHGAGVQAAQAVIGSGARVLITGRLGPKAERVLAAARIDVFESHTTVAQALDEYAAGRLPRLETH